MSFLSLKTHFRQKDSFIRKKMKKAYRQKSVFVQNLGFPPQKMVYEPIFCWQDLIFVKVFVFGIYNKLKKRHSLKLHIRP